MFRFVKISLNCLSSLICITRVVRNNSVTLGYSLFVNKEKLCRIYQPNDNGSNHRICHFAKLSVRALPPLSICGKGAGANENLKHVWPTGIKQIDVWWTVLSWISNLDILKGQFEGFQYFFELFHVQSFDGSRTIPKAWTFFPENLDFEAMINQTQDLIVYQ